MESKTIKVEILAEAKETVAGRYRKTWERVQEDYEYGMGVSKMLGMEDMMDLVCEEYSNMIIPKKQLLDLAKSIYSADPYGEDLVIKDLREHIIQILKNLNIKYKFKFDKK